MKNRYDKNLKTYNRQILALNPAMQTLRLIAALEFKKVYRSGKRVLEIGCGEGDSAKDILEQTAASLDLLDTSPKMIKTCKKNLKPFSKRTRYICSDALEHLEKSLPYDIIFSEWTIHNFLQEDKGKIFSAIHNNLKPKGVFILVDKVYPNKGGKELLESQHKRYLYLPAKGAKEIISHEQQDYSSEYRMDERKTLWALKKAGFKSPKIIDRVGREIVLIAGK
jgi:ubiquinone/menaquinone biosynthesis C-methylase UbiE